MAKLKGPCFSLSAAGSVNTITFSSQTTIPGGTAIARKKPKGRNTPRSSTQRNHNDRFRAGSSAWKTIEEETRTRWQTLATTMGTEARLLFIKEWMIQHIKTGNLPKIPAPII